MGGLPAESERVRSQQENAGGELMAWMCEAEEHPMEKPNLYYTSRALDRPAKTRAERESGKRWVAHCRGCEEAERPSASIADWSLADLDI